MLTLTNSCLLEMPTEVLFHIFHFLKLEDCLQQQRICQLFNKIINTDNFWKSHPQFNTISLPLYEGSPIKDHIIKLRKSYLNFSVIWKSCIGECLSNEKFLPVILNIKTEFIHFDDKNQVADRKHMRALQFAEPKFTKQEITKIYHEKLKEQKINEKSRVFGILFSSKHKYDSLQNCHIIQTNPELSARLKEELLQVEQIISRLMILNQKDLIAEKDFIALRSTVTSRQSPRERFVGTCLPA